MGRRNADVRQRYAHKLHKRSQSPVSAAKTDAEVWVLKLPVLVSKIHTILCIKREMHKS